jgi:osmotically-inducible protein OsmY
MKTLYSHLYGTYCMVMLLLFSMGQMLYATPQQARVEKEVEKVLHLYCPQEFNIKVTGDGLVRIRGDVDVLYDRLRAFDIVSKVEGVKEIQNEIVVQPPIVADKVIEASIVEKLGMNQAISEPAGIKVSVDKGFVFLSGNVHYYHEKLIANSIASWEKGVTGIQDDINVVPNSGKVQDDQTLNRILQEVLQRQFPAEQNVSLSVHDGVVTLEGRARTLWTEDRMAEELSNIMGVREVISNLKLNE